MCESVLARQRQSGQGWSASNLVKDNFQNVPGAAGAAAGTAAAAAAILAATCFAVKTKAVAAGTPAAASAAAVSPAPVAVPAETLLLEQQFRKQFQLL